MSFTYGGTEVQGVTYNGTEVQSITYNGTEVWSAIKPLANCTWSEIKEIIQAGKASRYWNVGDNKEFNIALTDYTYNDTRNIDISGTYRAMILGFDHNKDIETDGLPNVHFAIFKQRTDINVAYYHDMKDDGGYGNWGSNSYLCSNLNGMFYRNLPDELKNVIEKTKKHYFVKGSNSNYDREYENHIFIPDECEVTGAEDVTSWRTSQHERRYAYFENGGSPLVYVPRVSNPNSAFTYNWWLRSNTLEDGEEVSAIIDDTGSPGGQSSFQAAAIVPCFSIF
jgi:hypothetical protein